MRTLHFGLRVADLDRSLAFYTAVGYEVVTIELVHDRSGAVDSGSRLSPFVIHVEPIDVTIRELAALGIDAEAPTSPDGSPDFPTTWIVDPDGNRIELVQWPAGHADGITAADWAR
jgi:lactoylglutathione lyase